MSDSDYGFCPKCGAKVNLDSAYCSECGHVLDGSLADEAKGGKPNNSGKKEMSTGLFIAVILLAVYGIISVVSGLYLYFNVDPFFDYLDEVFIQQFGMTLQQYLIDSGVNITVAEMKDMLKTLGLMSLISGVLSVASLALVILRKYWIVAVLLCVAASLVTLMIGASAVLNVIVGLVVAFLIYREKDAFEC